jgi:hypothetical protein
MHDNGSDYPDALPLRISHIWYALVMYLVVLGLNALQLEIEISGKLAYVDTRIYQARLEHGLLLLPLLQRALERCSVSPWRCQLLVSPLTVA